LSATLVVGGVQGEQFETEEVITILKTVWDFGRLNSVCCDLVAVRRDMFRDMFRDIWLGGFIPSYQHPTALV
jgi:hypothetical protein